MPNPNHDPKNGQFTTSGRGGGSSGKPAPTPVHFDDDDDYGPMPATRYSGIDKPNPTLDEVAATHHIDMKPLRDAFSDLRFPSDSGPPQHHGARPPGKR